MFLNLRFEGGDMRAGYAGSVKFFDYSRDHPIHQHAVGSSVGGNPFFKVEYSGDFR